MSLEYQINPRKICLILGFLSLYFAAQSLVVEYVENVLDPVAHRSLILMIDLFSVNAELTIPTWYSTLLLFGAAVLLTFIAAAQFAEKRSYARQWAALAAIFLYLSIDEGAAIHEILADALQTDLTLTGYLAFGWQIIAAPLVLIFAVLYLRFLFHLPPRTRNLFILAGVIYVGGALVIEGISANQWYQDNGLTFHYLAIGTIEELAEMLGVVIFIYALLAYAVEMNYLLTFRPTTIPDEPSVLNTNDAASISSQLDAGISHKLHGISRYWPRQRFVIVTAMLILGLNVVLVSWALTQEPAPEPTIQNTVSSTQTIINQFVTDEVVATIMAGRFDSDNLNAHQMAAALLDLFDQVIVVVLPAEDTSIALAADDLPFDTTSISSALRASGEMQFIIFDTRAVKTIVSSFQDGE